MTPVVLAGDVSSAPPVMVRYNSGRFLGNSLRQVAHCYHSLNTVPLVWALSAIASPGFAVGPDAQGLW